MRLFSKEGVYNCMLEAQFVMLSVYTCDGPKLFHVLGDEVYVKSLLLCVADF